MAALADDEGLVRDVATEQLCAAAGVADRTYRRARSALLAGGELELVSGMGGRGNTNVWSVRDPRRSGDALRALLATDGAAGRRAPPDGGRLIRARRRCGAASTPDASKGGQDRTVSAGKCPILTGVTEAKGGHDRTVSPGKCPDLTGVWRQRAVRIGPFSILRRRKPRQKPRRKPRQKPRHPTRARGRNPRTPGPRNTPPTPLPGGVRPTRSSIEEAYVTARGRKRHRHVRVDLDAVRRGLGLPVLADRDAWERIRAGLRDSVGDSSFEIWLDPLELIAVDSTGALVISAPAATCSWLRSRYAGVLRRCAEREGRELRIADEPERRAFAVGDERGLPAVSPVHINHQEVS